jgi:isoleucyl-tRNA synthetase
MTENEKRILSFWKQNRVFERSVEQRKGAPLFAFYDGPPFATGLPHYGHLLASTIKDCVLRHWTQRGYYAPRRFGWDCHGLPVEAEVEKAEGLSGAAAVDAFGLEQFNNACRSVVLRYTEEWKATIERIGRWVDFDSTYLTMDATFMESVWWVFGQLYEKGLIYRGYKVMPYSMQLGTPLSNFEAGENYQEVDDPALTVALELEGEPGVSLLIWTTTPWTLPSNLAVAVAGELIYDQVEELATGRQYILAQARRAIYFPEEKGRVVRSMRGSELVGRHYRPLFDYFANQKGAFRVLSGGFVTTEDGTGIVHMAPAFGADDFELCRKEGIELVCPVDRNGRFTQEVPDFAGQNVKEADRGIIERLKAAGQLFKRDTIRHRYPFCYRTDTPLIYRVVDSWFVSVEPLRERLLQANQQIHWMPEWIRDGRFGKWLEGARDWCISRNRFWGTPMPIWMAEDGELVVVGSRAELQKYTGVWCEDLHRDTVDKLPFVKNGKQFQRIPEVFDCWFESGSMPYAQIHYPFENADRLEAAFPAQFIAEGIDQTRGWFYTLTVLAVALFDKPAFRNVVVNGIVLAQDGAKMSKRLRNYPDPTELLDTCGADAVRLYMLHSPAVRSEDLRFSQAGVEQLARQVLIPWHNAAHFFTTYAGIANWQARPTADWLPEASIDRWMISRAHGLIDQVRSAMDRYDLQKAVEPLFQMVDDLTDWYIRNNRRRFYEEDPVAFATLHRALVLLCHAAAPFAPFMAEAVYQQLRNGSDPISIHLTDYPQEHLWRDPQLEAQMSQLQEAVSLGYALRKEHKLKVRQPLPAVHIVCGDPTLGEFLRAEERLLLQALNVKELVLRQDEEALIQLVVKPNFRSLGKRFGPRMGEIAAAIAALNLGQKRALAEGQPVMLSVGETIDPSEVQVERTVLPGLVAATRGPTTVLLDTQLTEELLLEGLARELINKIATMRREAAFEVTDRISVQIDCDERVGQALALHESLIREEVLAKAIVRGPCQGTQWDINGHSAFIAIVKSH